MVDAKAAGERRKKRVQRAAAKTKAKEKAKVVKTKVANKPKQEAAGFMNFVRQQGVVGLAVGLVLGTQIKALVDQLIASFINPVLGLVLPGQGSLSQKVFVWDVLGKRAEFSYGAFIYVLISFLTVAFIIYYIVKALRLDKLQKQA
jgi:large conductance mechanosensitive channel protein